MKNEENALVVAENNNVLTIADKINENVKRCTLDLTDEDNQTDLYNVLTGDADILLNDIIDREIVMTGAYIDKHPAPVVDEGTGEVVGTTSKYRIIIFDDEGKTYATGSYGIYNALSMIFDIFGEPSKEHPIKVKVSKRATANGHSTLTLVRVK
jgi:hypothetical protein